MECWHPKDKGRGVNAESDETTSMDRVLFPLRRHLYKTCRDKFEPARSKKAGRDIAAALRREPVPFSGSAKSECD